MLRGFGGPGATFERERERESEKERGRERERERKRASREAWVKERLHDPKPYTLLAVQW